MCPALATADLFPTLGEDFVADPAPMVVVLTAIPVEYQAVREHLRDIEEQTHHAGTVFHLGRLPNGPWRVVLTQTGQGNQRAAALAERAIAHYRPDLVMLVGVAGRLHNDLSLGDVVVARKVYAVHGGKEDDTGFRPRPESWWPRRNPAGQTDRADVTPAGARPRGRWHGSPVGDSVQIGRASCRERV